MGIRTLIIDNYDSYTFNLYQMIAAINQEAPLVIRNDQLSWYELREVIFHNIDNIVISPGPGRPERFTDFGVCRQVIENSPIPLLGVCLGHQGIGYLSGGKVISAPEVIHGRLSKIHHNNSALFRDIPQEFSAVRYHSLLLDEQLPDCLEKTAWTQAGLVMGIRHRYLPFWGVQFHPESICTEYGEILLQNFKDITLQFQVNSVNNRKQEVIISGSAPKPALDFGKGFELNVRKLNIYPDTEQIFVHLFGQVSHAFWLDSSRVEPGLSRFSFMGDGNGENSLLVHYYTRSPEIIITEANQVTRRQESIFDFLKSELERRSCQSPELPFDFNCGFIGYFGYEMKAECGGKLVHSSTLPDAIFLFADRLIAVDHQEKCLYLLQMVKKGRLAKQECWFDTIQAKLESLPELSPLTIPENPQSINFWLQRHHQDYINDIHYCLEQIRAGDTYQVCLTNQLHTDVTPDPLTFYRLLRQVNPAPYAAFLRFGELANCLQQRFAIACSSPERFLQIDPQGWVETKPIKGTVPRGKTPAADFALVEQLRHSEKERSENLMIVDLLRNDLGRVCEVGSVHVPKMMDVETYATVHQLVTTVRGKLRSDLHGVDAIQAVFPGGSMTGAPKIRTMEIIDRLEKSARGIYSGAIGFLSLNGAIDLNIVIRTAVLTPDQTSIGIGGGIVALSDPEQEFAETMLKAKALIQAMTLTTSR